MSYIAFMLGLLGSMHCLVMCGPLVMGVARLSDQSFLHKIKQASVYNFGRIGAYVLLGIVFSMIGSALSVVGLQKAMSIITGAFLILLLVFSLDIESFIFKSSRARSLYARYFNYLSKSTIVLANEYAVGLGFLNGLLPCGMVYVALAGAMASDTIFNGAVFMFLFGIGTLPMMFSLMVGAQWVKRLGRNRLKRFIPIAQFCLGVYLIYRGIVVEAPLEFNFLLSLHEPLQCH
jgi:sulfite exporter TauE/SafE